MKPAQLILMFSVAAIALAGCASSPPGDGALPPDSGTVDGGNAAGNEERGHATVTINGETWDFPDRFICVPGYENTRSDVYSFSSDAKAEFGDAKVQFQVSVRDESGQNRLSGDGIRYEITLQDYGNYENPAVDYTIFAEDGVTITPTTVTVSGDYTNSQGETRSVQIDAVCGA